MNLHVTKYTGNVKGATEQKIGHKTLIVGPNGSKKSAICQGIQLALTGTCDEVLYRNDVAVEDRLILLAPKDEPLSAEVQLSDGTTASLRIARKDGGVGKKKLTEVAFDRERVFPFTLFRKALLGSDQALYNYLLSRVTRGPFDEVMTRIPASLHQLYEKLASGSGEKPNTVAALLYVTKEAKKRGRESGSHADGADQAALAAARGIAAPTADALETALKAMRFAREQVQNCVAWSAGDAARKLVEEAQADVERLRQEERVLIETITAAEPLSEEIGAALKNVLWHAKRHDCLVCGPDAPCAASFESLKSARIKKAQAKLNAHAETNAARERLAEVQTETAVAETRLETAQATLGHSRQRPSVDLPTARAALAKAEEKLRQLQADQTTLLTAQKSRDEAIRLRQLADQYKLLHEECEKTIELILAAGTKRFESEVQRWLPREDIFKLDLPHFGLMRGSNFCVPVSGSEMVKLGAALATACREQELTIYIGEDVGWDPRHLGDAMAALKSVPTQIILQSTVKPQRQITGWTIIETGEEIPEELM